jgi:hypothetical protein
MLFGKYSLFRPNTSCGESIPGFKVSIRGYLGASHEEQVLFGSVGASTSEHVLFGYGNSL